LDDVENDRMKKIIALGLAAAVATTAVVAVSSEASAQPWMHPHPHYQQPYNHRHFGYGFGGPSLFFGFGSPNYYQPDYYYAPPPPYGYYSNDHVQWCLQAYRTYNQRTDTYHPRAGVTAVCVAPFDR
jgi:hypothetical protein